jgi:hypothetical protein
MEEVEEVEEVVEVAPPRRKNLSLRRRNRRPRGMLRQGATSRRGRLWALEGWERGRCCFHRREEVAPRHQGAQLHRTSTQ